MSQRRFSTFRLVAAVVIITLYTVAAIVGVTWWLQHRPYATYRDYEPLGYGCRVEFPAPPQQTKLLESDTFTEYAAFDDAENRSYGLISQERFDIEFDETKPFRRCDQVLDEFVGKYALRRLGKPRSWITTEQFKCSEAELHTAQGEPVVVRVVGVGYTFFTLVVTGPNLHATHPAVVRYFDSFTITDPALLRAAENDVNHEAYMKKRAERLNASKRAKLLGGEVRVPQPVLYFPFDDEETDEIIEPIQQLTLDALASHATQGPSGKAVEFDLLRDPQWTWDVDENLNAWTISLWVRIPEHAVSAEILRTEAFRLRTVGGALCLDRWAWFGMSPVFESESFSVNQWVHVTVTCDSRQLAVWMDGEKVELRQSVVAASPLTALAFVWQLKDDIADATLALDEFALFDSLLTTTQIKRLATSDPK